MRVLLPEHQSWPWVYGDRAVKVLSAATNEISIRFKNRALAWRLALRFLRALRAWRRDADRLREEYVRAAPQLVTWESWRAIFEEDVSAGASPGPLHPMAAAPAPRAKQPGEDAPPPLPWSPLHPGMGE